MTDPEDFRRVPPGIAPGGEDSSRPRVLAHSQSGSLLDLEARELLGKFTHDSSLPRAIRDGAGRALRGDGTLRDVLELPEFSELRQRAAERFAEEMAEKTPEERDQISAALRAQYAGPYGTPTREDER